MNIKLFILFLGLSAFIKPASIVFLGDVDQSAFYNIIKTGNLNDINKELNLLDASNATQSNAYKGALLMRRAGLLKTAKEKLESFKHGRILLETAMQQDSANTEYHFLRLMIQEHAPKIVKYNKDLNEDAALVKSHFSTLSPDLQKIIIDYSHTSSLLKPQDFKA